MKKCAAIVLAGGKGTRMNSTVSKQYMELQGHPLLYYSLMAFEQSSCIDEIILVAGQGETEYCKEQFVQSEKISKIKQIVTGGTERYHSVYAGLTAISHCDYVFIHDGARPFLTKKIIDRAYEAVQKYGACVVGMPVKDTIKLTDENKNIKETPDRKFLWQAQTPQVFEFPLILNAYIKLMEQNPVPEITDDASVVEKILGKSVKMVEGSYENIKITTPEDMEIARIFIKR